MIKPSFKVVVEADSPAEYWTKCSEIGKMLRSLQKMKMIEITDWVPVRSTSAYCEVTMVCLFASEKDQVTS
jgi:hypothetical protein